MHWFLIHTKPRQEGIALENLERQGYPCYLPMLAAEELRQYGALDCARQKAQAGIRPGPDDGRLPLQVPPADKFGPVVRQQSRRRYEDGGNLPVSRIVAQRREPAAGLCQHHAVETGLAHQIRAALDSFTPGYSPRNAGLRLAMKAATPSRPSAVCAAAVMARASSFICVCSVLEKVRASIRLVRP